MSEQINDFRMTGRTFNDSCFKDKQFCLVNEWINKIKAQGPDLKRWLQKIYGDNQQLHSEKCKDLLRVLKCYANQFGFDNKVIIVRAPGRVNLMGRHVDHRGGFNNFVAIDRETMLVAGLRDDDNVVAVNTRPEDFKSVKFNISEYMSHIAGCSWTEFINSDWLNKELHRAAGNWGNYIKAPVIKLQYENRDIKIKGMNIALTGNVPIAAGLSSSSTIVVATLLAASVLNNIRLSDRQFIDMCGQGEWFVGSRGGSGDHAAIYLGQKARVTQVANHPFKVIKAVNIPADYNVIIADSHVKAAKSAKAKHIFNERVTSYNLGLTLLKQRFSEIADKVKYLRDINPENLNCSESDIYRLLLSIPEFMTRDDFRSQLSTEYQEIMETNFSSHDEPERYRVRGVLLFGIAEIARSKVCVDYFESNQVEQFGKLMKISHDGDRVSKQNDKNEHIRYEENCTDEYLRCLMADLQGGDSHKANAARLYMQPGFYACSTEDIDRMVDIACSVSGVAGAQIVGAGLGGCIMILAGDNCIESVRTALAEQYYRPRGLEPAVIPCITSEGAGLAQF